MIMAPAMAGLTVVLLLAFAGLIVAGVFSLVLITLLLFGFATGVNSLLNAVRFVKLNRDLRDGQKRLVNAPVEAQDIDVPRGGGSASSYNFWVKAGGRKLAVTEQQYYQLKKGDVIQAYVAPYSGTVLGISKTERPSSSSAPVAVAAAG
jgi:uncharacterized protein (DUF58 family)